MMNGDGKRKRRLTRNALADESPTWSPDGKLILFTRGLFHAGRRERVHADLWVMNMDGSNQRRLTRTPALELDPAWAPRGGRIAFLLAGRSTRRDEAGLYGPDYARALWTAAPDGSRRRASGITHATFPAPEGLCPVLGGPDWSPDGSRLALATSAGVVVVAANGSDARVIGPGFDPAWAPDGSQLAVAATIEDGFTGIRLLTPVGSWTALTWNPAPSAEVLVDQGSPDWQPLP